ncbi:MAG: hypothetical protein AAB243_03250, partial [Planctomycetota bacterium]
QIPGKQVIEKNIAICFSFDVIIFSLYSSDSFGLRFKVMSPCIFVVTRRGQIKIVHAIRKSV